MVTDFGIARAVSEGGGDSRLTATGMAIGTPAYMSPEQCAGEREIDGRSDLYSLGIVGYQMLTGELPFAASNTPAMLVKHISEAPLPIEQRRADLPPDLARGIMMLLEKEPANRFPSASALAVALEHGDVPAPPVRPQPLRSSPAPRATHGEGLATLPGPTSEELQRFNADPVAKFRRKLAFYGFVSPILFLTSVVGNSNFMTIWVFWTIYIAYQYAKLWTDGFDWRDVFRQPRHRSLYEVATETIDDMQGLLDKEKRQEVLERARQRRLSGGSTAPSSASPVPELLSQAGRNGGRIQQAALDRDEIVRLVDSMPAHERGQIPDVIPSARALYDRIQQLALSLADLERNVTPGALDEVEREIVQLEAAANPLERAASETRVRRLAHLKRQRRALSEVVRRRDAAAEKLETCSLALQNMRFDVLRLRAGAQTHARITSLAVEAMNLARDIDTALYAAGEVDRLTGRGSPRAADAV
jgi:serine/threonine-protein kinase